MYALLCTEVGLIAGGLLVLTYLYVVVIVLIAGGLLVLTYLYVVVIVLDSLLSIV